MVERRTPKREVPGSNPRPPFSVLEQDIKLPLVLVNTQETVAPSKHD